MTGKRGKKAMTGGEKIDALLALARRKSALDEAASLAREAMVIALAAVDALRDALENDGGEGGSLAISNLVSAIESCDGAQRYIRRRRSDVVRDVSARPRRGVAVSDASVRRECTWCGLLEDEHRLAASPRTCSGFTLDEGLLVRRRAQAAFGDAVQGLVHAVAPFFMSLPVLGVRVSEDLGLDLGVAPGKTGAVMTECGVITVEVEPNPRRDELTIAGLRRALKDALDEVDEHNHEYKYKTSKAKLDHWRRLVSEGAVAEAVARLDAAGGDDGGSAHRSCIGSAGCKTQTPQSIDDPSSGSPAK